MRHISIRRYQPNPRLIPDSSHRCLLELEKRQLELREMFVKEASVRFVDGTERFPVPQECSLYRSIRTCADSYTANVRTRFVRYVRVDVRHQYQYSNNNNNTRTQVLNAINRRERAQRTSRRREKQKRIVEAKFTIDLSRLHHHKITLGKDRDGREYNLMAGDTSTVFVCETNKDTKSWAYFDAKKHLSELLKWFDPKKYESEALLTRRVRMLKDAHENNLVPSNSETMSNLSDMISIGFNHEIETLIPKTLTCFKPSELSCKFCGYQAREGERHCRYSYGQRFY